MRDAADPADYAWLSRRAATPGGALRGLKILSHGLPFFCDYAILRQYRGRHELRTLSAQPGADYRLRPEVDTIEDLLERLAPEFVPDLILVWTPENDPPPLGIERSPVRTACLAGDWNLFYSAQRMNLGRYDVVISDRPGVEILTSDLVKPVYAFPLYSQNSLVHYEEPRERDIDVLYVGNLNLSHRAERGRWLQRLALLSDRHNIRITNNAWGDEYRQLLSRAKIVFNHSVRGEVNLRVFESMACGALAFLEAANAEAREHFTDGEDIVLYEDDNFEERIEYYLFHPEEMQRITGLAREQVKAFRGEDRFDALIDFISAQPDSGRPFLQLPEKERALQDHLQYAVTQRTEYWATERHHGARLKDQYPDDPRALSAFAHSVLYWRDRPLAQDRSVEVLQALRMAVKLAPTSAVHALNAATAAQYYGQTPLAKLYLQLTLRCDSAEPADYLWGAWTSQHWTGWLRAFAEGRHTLESIQAEARLRLALILLGEGTEPEALEHFEAARALDPSNTHGLMEHAELLWKHERREESIRLVSEALPTLSLNAPIRMWLATRYAELALLPRARQLMEEARCIERVLQPATAAPLVKSHANKQESAATDILEAQETRLRARARQGENPLPLMLFLATLGRLDEVAQLPVSLPVEQALQAILTDADRPLTELLAALEGATPVFYHLLLKRCLKHGKVAEAFSVCHAAAVAHPRDTTCWNLLARFLSRLGDPRAGDTVEASLAISPQQFDIARLRDARFDGKLFLEPVPRRIPISFYLPVYNVANYIGHTLERVLHQCYPMGELFIVNDGSTDDSIEIARSYPVRILHHDENRGLAAARNTALVEATGEWLMSVDTDAAPEPDYLLNLAMEIETRDLPVAALGGMLIEQFQESPADKWRAHMMRQHHGDTRLQPPLFVYGSTMCVLRSAALAAGGYPEDHRTNGEDSEFCKSLAAAGYSFVYTPRARAWHQRQDSVSSALRSWWGWYYWVKMEANAYSSVSGLMDALLRTLAIAGVAFNEYLASDTRDLWYLAFLHPLHDACADFGQAVKTGQILPGEARALQDALLAEVGVLDLRLGGDLLSKVRADLSPVLTPLAATEAVPLSEGFRREWERYRAPLAHMFESFPTPLYEVLSQGLPQRDEKVRGMPE
jgi:GT2 family glycosyltransferase/tetratricopeptide (TPR) repeat protein